MRKLNWLVAFLLFFGVGCFLSTAHAKDERKDAPAKNAPQKKNTQQAKRGEEHRGAEHRAEIHHFHGRDYHHWNAHDREVWRGGVWRHERYMGRYGYWWVVGGMWYFYETKPAGLYPVVVPAVAFEAPVVAAPVVVQQPPVEQPVQRPPLKVQAQAKSWYFCDNPKGYSPYISSCPGGWRTVPAQGPGQPPPPQ